MDPPSSVEVLAKYSDPLPNGTEAISTVLVRTGKGVAILSGVHIEYPLQDPPARDAIRKTRGDVSLDNIEVCEKERIQWVGDILEKLGLRLPSRITSTDPLAPQGEEDPSLLLHPTHPSPIFILPLPTLPRLGEFSFASPALVKRLSSEPDGTSSLQDANDLLHIKSVNQFAASSSSSGSIPHRLAEWRRSPPSLESASPPIENLTISETAPPAPPPAPDFNSIPKTLLLPCRDTPYAASWTPLFNFETYWSELAVVRKKYGKRHGALKKGFSGKEEPALGDLVWYAETVTSTQTMLDR